MKPDNTLRLATWNIHMGIGRDKKRDLGRTSRVIQEMEPDIIGLQEVDNHIGDSGNDLESLHQTTGLQVIAGPTMNKPTGDYGNALLTRLPVLRVERHEISVQHREPRGILIVHLEGADEPMQVAVTHLGLHPGERREQVQRLINILSAGVRSPLILMGDFNEWLFWGRSLRWLRSHFGRFSSPATFPSGHPFLKLDHILCEPQDRLKNVQVHKSRLARIASDHLPLTASYQYQKMIS